MEKPRTYLDSVRRINNNYYFVSYSHIDYEEVYCIIDKLYNLNYNVWYDSGLSAGDIWINTVRKKLEESNCRGVLIFVSKNTIMSESVYKELAVINEMQDFDESFTIVPIDLDGTLRKVMENNLAEFQLEECQKGVEALMRILDDNQRIFIENKGVDEVMESLSNLFQKDNIITNGEINLRNSNIFDIDDWEATADGKIVLKIGECVTFDNKKEVVRWELVARCERKLYFVTEFAIKFVTMNMIVSTEITMRKSLKDYRYLDHDTVKCLDANTIQISGDVLSYSLPSDYADSQRYDRLRLFWVKNNGAIKVVNSKNVFVEKVENCNNIFAGIRLQMIIDEDKISGVKYGED